MAKALEDVRLSDVAATHLAKLRHSGISDQQAVRCMRTTGYEPDFSYGLCSVSIRSDHVFSTTLSGSDIGPGQALAAGNSALLPALVRGESHPPAGHAIPTQVWQGWRNELSAMPDTEPDGVERFGVAAYFETGRTKNDAILTTPTTSVKLVHALNERIGIRWAATKKQKAEIAAGDNDAVAADPETGEITTRPPLFSVLAVGGANPQNVGAIVNKTTETTRRGGYPVLMARAPRAPQQSRVRQWMRRLGATGRYTSVPFIPEKSAVAFVARALAAYDLATHRYKEAAHARKLVAHFMYPAEALGTALQRLGDDLERPPWCSLNATERAWLLGEPYDRAVLIHGFTHGLRERVQHAHDRAERAAGRKNKDAPGVLLPARATQAIEDAFREALS